jgi:glycerophosphoryl diester phosphodiesterase
MAPPAALQLTATPFAPARSRAAHVTVFGHRGASGYRPEHTLASYDLAIRMGADHIEPDLVSTADGVLVARHENEISGTTDVADHPEFADRHTTKTVDGRQVTGWFTEDFTLRELRTLRAVERLPHLRPANTTYDATLRIPTFTEVLAFARAEGIRHGRRIGVAPETKHPTYFRGIGLGLEEPLLRSLSRFGMDNAGSGVVIQSFETANLRALSRRTRVPLVQLTAAVGAPFDLAVSGDPRGYADLMTPRGLRDISSYAAWLGPEKNSVIPRTPAGALAAPSRLVDDAHAAGLQVVVHTFRAENQFLPVELRRGTDPSAHGDLVAEIRAFTATGIDGLFADHPDLAVAATT